MGKNKQTNKKTMTNERNCQTIVMNSDNNNNRKTDEINSNANDPEWNEMNVKCCWCANM